MQNHQNPYHFLKTYCIRTPLFSLNFHEKLFIKGEIELITLTKLWSINTIKEAIFLASPELYNQLENYLLRGIENSDKSERLKQTFLKYLIRASTRCTPFGLFAGVTTGYFNKSTVIKLKPNRQFNRVTKFDTNYLSSLLNHISNINVIKEQLLFYPNTTLYKVADQYRYVEFQLKETKCSYSIEVAEFTTYLEKIISISKRGETINELANSLVVNDISFDDAKSFIEILINNQILVSELELSVTGEDTLASIIRVLNKLNNTKGIVETLKSLQNQLKRLDETIGNDNNQYFEIIDMLKKIEAPFNSKYLFQTDLFSSTLRL